MDNKFEYSHLESAESFPPMDNNRFEYSDLESDDSLPMAPLPSDPPTSLDPSPQFISEPSPYSYPVPPPTEYSPSGKTNLGYDPPPPVVHSAIFTPRTEEKQEDQVLGVWPADFCETSYELFCWTSCVPCCVYGQAYEAFHEGVELGGGDGREAGKVTCNGPCWSQFFVMCFLGSPCICCGALMGLLPYNLRSQVRKRYNIHGMSTTVCCGNEDFDDFFYGCCCPFFSIPQTLHTIQKMEDKRRQGEVLEGVSMAQ